MGNKIILVEDETNIRAMYKEVLVDAGFEVVEIVEGLDALTVLNEGDWDMLLLDIMLPKLDGVELLKKLNANSVLKDKPVIIITNLEDEQIKSDCFKNGAKDFLVKSNIMPGDLVLAVKKHVFVE